MERPECCGKPMWKTEPAQSGRMRWKCGKCGTRTTASGESAFHAGYDRELAGKNHRQLKKKIKKGQKKFVITAAQNNTRKDNKFFQALKNYCEYNSAELIIIPIHYKNISLYTAAQEYKKEWDPELQAHFIDEELLLGGNVLVKADISLGATLFNPLSGKEPIGGNRWTIFGHPQFAMEPVASPGKRLPKRMYTSGAVTTKNYSKTNVGAKAEFHHVVGALVVEVVGKHAFVRHLNADSASGFYDLDHYYGHDRVEKDQRILALTTGDEHVKFMRPGVRKATYDDPASIVNTLKPSYIFRHDVLDGYAGSHHHEKDDVLQFRKYHKRDHDYKTELDQVVSFINNTTPDFAETVFVPSNHHDHLYKWLSRVDPKKDPQNALLIHELKSKQYANALCNATTDPFEIYLTPRLNCSFRFLDRSTPFELMGVDYSQHGDVGTNGSRGSARGLAKTTSKMVIGHAHGARIVRGVYQVGTSTGQLEYERGLGDHTNTHCVQYPNGKRTLIDVFGTKWRG
jgi:hypothetical protein